ncbi:MAG: membrane dipeptidase, partial [Myxococcota bacterium]|nr:membrane dipeptidase [Myxococcota bacterium]
QEAHEVHQSALVVDLHCDLLLTTHFTGWNWTRRHRPNPLPGAPLMGHTDLPRLRDGNIGCMALGMVVSPLRRRSGPRAIHRYLDMLHRQVERAPDSLEIACSSQAIRTARQRGRIACFAGLEGAHALNGQLDELPALKARGLGYVGLAHFTGNAACRPMVGWGSNDHSGLTDFGRELVDELNRLGIAVDVAHVNRPGLIEVCARSPVPVICSHTACTAVHRSPRGLDDAQLRAIADTGGVVGVIFVTPFIGPGGLEAVVAHLNHLRRTIGVEHAALGTDWEGFALYPRDLNSADKLPLLTDALLRDGWTPQEILAVYGDNFLRALAELERVTP